VLTLAIGACSTDEGSTAEAADSSATGGATISTSAQGAVTDLLGDVSASTPDPNDNVKGVAYGTTDSGVLATSVDNERRLLQIKLHGIDGGRIPMKNGGAVRLNENLIAEVFIDPFPTHTLTAWIDLFLRDASGAPVGDANVLIDYDMFSMGHGPFFTTSEKSPNGHYTFRLDYVMFGPWEQILTIQDPSSDTEYTMDVVVVAVP